MSGIDPRNGTCLHLVVCRRLAGWPVEKCLDNISFDHPFPEAVAKALLGDHTVSLDAIAEARKLADAYGIEIP